MLYLSTLSTAITSVSSSALGGVLPNGNARAGLNLELGSWTPGREIQVS